MNPTTKSKNKKSLIISIIQPEIVENEKLNYKNIEDLIKSASNTHPDIICLPEKWVYLNPFVGREGFLNSIQKERGKQYLVVKEWAKKYSTTIISGGMYEWRENFDKPFITCYLFNELGEELGRQDKIQLYGLEQNVFQPGSVLNVFSYKNIKFSVLICFDLNISSKLAKKCVINGVEFIFSPTFIRDDGEENWESYVKVRALENRIPLCSVNSIMNYGDRQFCGKSKIITFKRGQSSPVKLLIKEASNSSTFITQEIGLRFPNKIRKKRLKEIENIVEDDLKVVKL